MELEESTKYVETITRFFPLLQLVSARLKESGAFRGARLGWHCHLTEQTAVAVKAAIGAGAKVLLSEANRATTSNGAVALMENYGAQVFRGANAVLDLLSSDPDVLSDTGLVLIEGFFQEKKRGRSQSVLAAQEITTSGIARLDHLISEGLELPIAILDINGGVLKERIENFHAVGQGVVEALNLILGRSQFGSYALVIGYGAVGAGVAQYLRNTGINCSVCEIDPVRRLLAHYDGFATVVDTNRLKEFDLIVTATGKIGLVGKEHWSKMKDGAIVANVGHWREELDLQALEEITKERRQLDKHIEQYVLANSDDGSERKIYVLTSGDPVNVVLLTGSPEPTLIHLSTELLALGFLRQQASGLKPGKQSLPAAIEREVATLCLSALGKGDQ